jgi:carbon starvation protein
VSMVLTLALVLTGTWVYLWQLFGASNQLMAALSLLIVTVWLASTGRNPAFVGIPMLFMYTTTVAASLVTAYNLYNTVAVAEGASGIAVAGAWAMIIVALLITVAALVIAYDGWQAWTRYRAAPVAPQPVGGGGGK